MRDVSNPIAQFVFDKWRPNGANNEICSTVVIKVDLKPTVETISL